MDKKETEQLKERGMELRAESKVLCKQAKKVLKKSYELFGKPPN